jgi:hypothetical protein
MQALLRCALAGLLVFLPMAVGFAKGPTASKVSEMADSVVKSRTTIEESIAAYPGPAPAHTIRSERLELRQAERLQPRRSLRKRLSRRRPTASPIAENQAPERRRWINRRLSKADWFYGEALRHVPEAHWRGQLDQVASPLRNVVDFGQRAVEKITDA